MGLVLPETQVTIGVRSKPPVELTKEEIVSQSRIPVNMFRSSCTEAELNEYYDKLSEQHPELIQTQSIDKVIMLEGDGDAKSARSPQRREPCVKVFLSRDEADIICCNNAELNSVKNQILASNQLLKGVSQNLDQLEKVLHGLIFIGISAFGVIMILPYLYTKVIVEEPPEEPEVELTMYEYVVGSLRGAYDWCIDGIYEMSDFASIW